MFKTSYQYAKDVYRKALCTLPFSALVVVAAEYTFTLRSNKHRIVEICRHIIDTSARNQHLLNLRIVCLRLRDVVRLAESSHHARTEILSMILHLLVEHSCPAQYISQVV